MPREYGKVKRQQVRVHCLASHAEYSHCLHKSHGLPQIWSRGVILPVKICMLLKSFALVVFV